MLKIPKIISKTLSVRLSLLAVGEIALLLCVSLAVMLYFSRQTLREEAMQDAEQTLEGTVKHIDNILLSVEQSLGNFYWDILKDKDNPDVLNDYCRKIVDCNSKIVGCAIVFKPNYFPGHELFMAYVHRKSSNPDSEEWTDLVTQSTFTSRPYTDQTWYTKPMTIGRPCWIDPLKNENTESDALTSFCIPLYNSGKECVGVVAVDMPIKYLSDIILSAKPSPNGYITLLSESGSFIVHPDTTKLSHQTVFTQLGHGADSSVREAAEAMVSGKSGLLPFRMNGEKWYVIYKPFKRAQVPGRAPDELKWSVGVVYPENDIFGEFNKLLLFVIPIAILGLILFFVCCWFITHRQLLPLQMLTSSAERISSGKFDETIPDTNSDDEIGQFQKHFQQMQKALVANISELEQLTATLDERGSVLKKAYAQAQEADKMKMAFLHNMTNQMIAPSLDINKRVTELCDSYKDISQQKMDGDVKVINEQGKVIIDLLGNLIHAAEDETGKEAAHEG